MAESKKSKTQEEYEKEILELAKKRGMTDIIPEEVRESIINNIADTNNKFAKLDPKKYQDIEYVTGDDKGNSSVTQENFQEEQESTSNQESTNFGNNHEQDTVTDNRNGGFRFEKTAIGLRYERNVFNKVSASIGVSGKNLKNTFAYDIKDLAYAYDLNEIESSMNIKFINGTDANVRNYFNQKDNFTSIQISSMKNGNERSVITFQMDIATGKQIVQVHKISNGNESKKEYVTEDRKTYVEKSEEKKKGLLGRFKKPKQLSRDELISELESEIKLPTSFDFWALDDINKRKGIVRKIDSDETYPQNIMEFVNDFRKKIGQFMDKIEEIARSEEAKQQKVEQTDVRTPEQGDKDKTKPKKEEMTYDD